MKRSSSALLFLAVLSLPLAACNKPASQTVSDGIVPVSKTDIPAQVQNDAPAGYTDYSTSHLPDEVITNGERKILFFSSTSPVSLSADEQVRAWYALNASTSVKMYKVNFDGEAALKARYGVSAAPTFVLIDGRGNVVDKADSTQPAKLQDLLRL